MSNTRIQEELRKTQEFAEKIEIRPYAQVQKNLDRAAADTVKKVAEWMAEESEQLAINL